MNDAMATFIKQKGKNITLLIVCGTLVALYHEEAAIAVMTAVSLAVGAPAVAEKWSTSGETK
jgi:hypothetical protein